MIAHLHGHLVITLRKYDGPAFVPGEFGIGSIPRSRPTRPRGRDWHQWRWFARPDDAFELNPRHVESTGV
jgi:hypothetical protein